MPDLFDDAIVFNQLQSSGMLAYYDLMQFGYPNKIPIIDLFEKLKPYLEPRHISIGVNNCCELFLLSIGFLSKDFKLGKTEIHFRPVNFHVMDRINVEFTQSKNQIEFKFEKGFNAFMQREQEQNQKICHPAEQSESIREEQPKQEFNEELRDVTLLKKCEEAKKVTENEPTKREYEKLPKPSIRFDGKHHLPDFDHREDGRRGYRCKLEGCGKQTTVYCDKCKVHICFVPGEKKDRRRNCFKKFHTLEEN